MGRITINDIARISGYSKTSVSFAFNDPGRISDKAREKILSIASELGYIPDPVARNLSLRRHGTIGLLLPQVIPLAFLNPHLSQIIQGIGEVCERAAHSLTVIPPVRESILDGVRNAAVDGLITLGLEPGMESVELIRKRHLPFVTIDGRDGGGFPVVGIDDRGGAADGMRTILNAGHRDVAIISFVEDPRLATSHVKNQRLAGYNDALAEAGLAESPRVRFVESEPSLSGGRETMEALLESSPPPSAVVAMSDVIAIGVLQQIETAGLSAPRDVSVIGFDNIPEAVLVSPRLTTIAQPGVEKGRRAAELLMGLIEGEEVDHHVVLPVRTVERESVGPRVA